MENHHIDADTRADKRKRTRTLETQKQAVLENKRKALKCVNEEQTRTNLRDSCGKICGTQNGLRMTEKRTKQGSKRRILLVSLEQSIDFRGRRKTNNADK